MSDVESVRRGNAGREAAKKDLEHKAAEDQGRALAIAALLNEAHDREKVMRLVWDVFCEHCLRKLKHEDGRKDVCYCHPGYDV
jgi:hypothetical protein